MHAFQLQIRNENEVPKVEEVRKLYPPTNEERSEPDGGTVREVWDALVKRDACVIVSFHVGEDNEAPWAMMPGVVYCKC